MVIRTLIALILLVAPASADEFRIRTPQSLATITMPVSYTHLTLPTRS